MRKRVKDSSTQETNALNGRFSYLLHFLLLFFLAYFMYSYLYPIPDDHLISTEQELLARSTIHTNRPIDAKNEEQVDHEINNNEDKEYFDKLKKKRLKKKQEKEEQEREEEAAVLKRKAVIQTEPDLNYFSHLFLDRMDPSTMPLSPDHFYHFFLDQLEPHRFSLQDYSNLPVAQWNALKKWNPKYFQSHPDTHQLYNVKKNSNQDFVYHADEQMVFAQLKGWKKPEEKIKVMSAVSFFESIEHPVTGEYLYFNDEFREMSQNAFLRRNEPYNFNKSILSDISPYNLFAPPEGTGSVDENIDYVGLWMGGNGVVTAPHYDVAHNFFVQIYGRKRFLIFPPEQHSHFYFFPSISPNYRQSQVNLSFPNFFDFPKLREITAIDITLEPGDVMYLPPFWIHHVTSLDECISVNFWSTCQDQLSYQDLLDLPFPLETKVDQEKLLKRWSGSTLVLKKYVTRRYIERLVEDVTALGLLECKAETSSCSAEQMEMLYEARYQSWSAGSAPAFDIQTVCPLEKTPIDREIDFLLQDKVAAANQFFLQFSSPAILQILLWDFFEELIEWAFEDGNAQEIPFFIQNCFQ